MLGLRKKSRLRSDVVRAARDLEFLDDSEAVRVDGEVQKLDGSVSRLAWLAEEGLLAGEQLTEVRDKLKVDYPAVYTVELARESRAAVRRTHDSLDRLDHATGKLHLSVVQEAKKAAGMA